MRWDFFTLLRRAVALITMVLRPYARLTLRSPLPASEVGRRLAGLMTPRWSWSARQPFRGSLEGSHFEASRRIRYRNTFRPVILGDVVPADSGSTVRIVMRLHSFAIGFVVFVAGALLFVAERAFVLRMHFDGVLAGLRVVCVLAAFYVVVVAAFWFDAFRSRSILSRELGCDAATWD